jgi:hypothetical protein
VERPLVTDVNGDGVEDVLLFARRGDLTVNQDDDTYVVAFDGASQLTKQLWVTHAMSSHLPRSMRRAGKSIVAIDGRRGISLYWAANGANRTQFALTEGGRALWHQQGIADELVYFEGIDGVAHAIDGNAGAVLDDRTPLPCRDENGRCPHQEDTTLADIVGPDTKSIQRDAPALHPGDSAWVAGDRFLATSDTLGRTDVTLGDTKRKKVIWTKSLSVWRDDSKVWGLETTAGVFFTTNSREDKGTAWLSARAIDDTHDVWSAPVPLGASVTISAHRVFVLGATDDNHGSPGDRAATLTVFDAKGTPLAKITSADVSVAALAPF